MKLVGEYGLRNKRELWRVQMVLSKIRNAARTLLTLDEKDPKRIFEGQALMRRMYKYGLLNETQVRRQFPTSSNTGEQQLLSGTRELLCKVPSLRD